ncbi:hypothetical protein [Terrabacter sp. Root85]|uniref:hypothetical protein n=1 Tax=Terrabacter sp. Root85 TaxID=1736603 RepID=UPI000A98069B|nr:hypothetical protein [Terrabacter sp. Root85]
MTTATETTARPEHRPHRQPSQRALATRSLTAALRLTGDDRREALRAHFDEFVPPRRATCPLR